MSDCWYVEIIFSDASGWEAHAEALMEALKPISGTLGQDPDIEGHLSVRVAIEAPDAIKAVREACAPVMDALLSMGLHAVVIRSTEVLSEAEMDAFLGAAP